MRISSNDEDTLAKKWLPDSSILAKKYTFYNYNHAAEILSLSFPKHFNEITTALKKLEITKQEILQSGGNESSIPPKFNAELNPKGWKEIRISGDLLIKFFARKDHKGFLQIPRLPKRKFLTI